jgi:hypothetical protein
MLNLLYSYVVHTNLRPESLVRHTLRSYSLSAFPCSGFICTYFISTDIDEALLQNLPSSTLEIPELIFLYFRDDTQYSLNLAE